jgi:hypothetical protein
LVLHRERAYASARCIGDGVEHRWRRDGVNVNQNAVYLECFMDELAAAAKVDALEFRLRLLGNQPKAAAVLKAVAEKGGWSKPLADGVQGRDLAVMRSFGSYTEALAEVSVDTRARHLFRAAPRLGRVRACPIGDVEAERQAGRCRSRAATEECSPRDVGRDRHDTMPPQPWLLLPAAA